MPANRWAALVQAATFASMRTKADELVPDEQLGLFTNKRAFFRSGQPRQWRDILDDDDLAAYNTVTTPGRRPPTRRTAATRRLRSRPPRR